MADTLDKETRSRMMAAIRGKNTKPEMVLRKALHAIGFHYQLNGKGIIFSKWRGWHTSAHLKIIFIFCETQFPTQ